LGPGSGDGGEKEEDGVYHGRRSEGKYHSETIFWDRGPFALLAFIHLGYTVLYILTTVYNQQARKAIRAIYSESDMPCVPAYYIIYTRFWYSYSPVYVSKAKSSSSHCAFFPFTAGGALYNHNPTNIIHPTTVTVTPEIHGHAALMTQLRGHSSCAKWRTVTVVLSSMFERKGRRNSTRKLKIPC
jgi:hypothetical protein